MFAEALCEWLEGGSLCIGCVFSCQQCVRFEGVD